MSSAGRLELILGPMFAGKSTELQRRLVRFQHGPPRDVVCITHRSDTRYIQLGNSTSGSGSDDDELRHSATHNRQLYPARAFQNLEAADAWLRSREAMPDVIAVDEGQFFDDLATFAPAWADAGVHVIVAALSGTFQRQSFAPVAALLGGADDVQFLAARCTKCGNDRAAFSHRHATDQVSVVLVGADEAYSALCRTCFVAAK